MPLPTCASFELTRSTPPSATYHASFSGWAAFDASACQLEPREGFQWLSFETDVRTTGPNLLERQAHGAVRAVRDGTVSGVARVSWDGTTSVASKFLLAGESSLQPGALPSPHDSCSERSACGACVDGFNLADCGCDAGAAEVTFSHPVRAGELVQVAAVPSQFDGAEALRGELFVAFSEGGVCDYNDVDDDHGACGASPWDGVTIDEEGGCVVERFQQTVATADAPLELASRGCALTPTANTAPFAWSRAGDGGADFSLTVQVRQASNVQWNAGGLLVTADADGSTEWLSLRVAQAERVELGGAHNGAALGEAEALLPPGESAQPWLQLRRVGGEYFARWRPTESDAWRDLGGGGGLFGQSGVRHPVLAGAVRVGLTQQTQTQTVGSVTLARYEATGAVHSAAPPSSSSSSAHLLNEVAWTDDACVGAALAFDEVDDAVLVPAAALCALGGGGGWSVELWFRTAELEGQWYAFGQYGEFEEYLFSMGELRAAGSLNVFLLEGEGPGRGMLRTVLCDGGGACTDERLDVTAAGGSFADDAWHQFVLVWDGSSTARVYVDGEERAAAEVGAGAGGGGGGAAAALVGGRSDRDALRFYGGLISNVSVRPRRCPQRSRSATRRTLARRCPRSPPPPAPPAPPPGASAPPPPAAPGIVEVRASPRRRPPPPPSPPRARSLYPRRAYPRRLAVGLPRTAPPPHVALAPPPSSLRLRPPPLLLLVRRASAAAPHGAARGGNGSPVGVAALGEAGCGRFRRSPRAAAGARRPQPANARPRRLPPRPHRRRRAPPAAAAAARGGDGDPGGDGTRRPGRGSAAKRRRAGRRRRAAHRSPAVQRRYGYVRIIC